MSCTGDSWMIDVKQQISNDLIEGSIIEVVSATSQLELIQGPYMPIQNFQIATFSAIIISQKY
jgi:hypothetical protein